MADYNQDNAISSEDIQTSVVADSREVYQQSEIYNGTKRRSRTLTEKGKEYQLKILFEKRKRKWYSRMRRKCKLRDDLMYSSSNVTTAKDAVSLINSSKSGVFAQRVCWSAATRSV